MAGGVCDCWTLRGLVRVKGFAGWEMSAGWLWVDLTTCTGGDGIPWPWVRFDDESGGPIDAPDWIAAGCMSAKCGESMGVAVLRGWGA